MAVDDTQPIARLLRKCLILGQQLRNQQLKDWANQELNGYKTIENVPDYRHLNADARGNFCGAFGSQLRSRLIPSVALKEDHRHWAEKVYLVQGVSAFDDLLRTEAANEVTFPWPPNMVVFYQKSLIQGYALASAWQELSKSAIVELLDTVRNRTLNMALEIKEELGTSYEDLQKMTILDAAKIQNIVVNNIRGDDNYLALGDINIVTETVISVADRQKLDEVLRGAGLETAALEKLTEAIESDNKKKGNQVASWIKENASKVLVGGVNIGLKVGTEILTNLLKRHLGLP